MSVHLNDQDINITVSLLIDKYEIPETIIKKMFGSGNFVRMNQLLKKFNMEKATIKDIARLLIVRKGSYLFAGSDEDVRSLRAHLLRKLPDDVLQELYKRNPLSGKNITSTSHMITPLSQKKWIHGGPWAKEFINTLGFPSFFSGTRMTNKQAFETILDVEPRRPVPKLVDFQVGLKDKMLQILKMKNKKTRCVVTLPTGGGKTRVAVEAFIEWMQMSFSNEKYLIWVAQSEELCEQAIACISAMWQEKEYPESLRIYRYFGGSTVKEDDLIGGVLVANIQQLYARIKNHDIILDEILKNCGAMIIDEAHHATAPIYNALLKRAEELCGIDLFPICGLTATPGRSNGGTEKLVTLFQAELVKPQIAEEFQYELNPLQYFREKGYLAKPRHKIYQSNRKYELKENDIDLIQEDLSKNFLKHLANDDKRNARIVNCLLEIPKGKQTIVYCCTVEHAEFLASILNSICRTAVSISADTPKNLRRMYIEAFKSGEIEFIFNYGVLTTGFDAPKTEYIVICRPTTSVILYEQIVGRGLRGPKFGGTEYCTIIDFADNLLRLGKPLAYTRFNEFWEREETDEVIREVAVSKA